MSLLERGLATSISILPTLQRASCTDSSNLLSVGLSVTADYPLSVEGLNVAVLQSYF